MRTAALLLILAPSLAVAEDRTTTVTIAGMAGALEPEPIVQDVYYYDYYEEPQGIVGPRLTLSWENAPLAYPETPGYNVDVALVPELTGGAFFDDAKAQLFLGVGFRGELKMAQKEQGLLKVSARGAVYLAARGLVVGDGSKPYGEFAIGDYFIIGKSTRLGFEGSLLVTSADQMTEYDDSTRVGGLVQLYIGFQP